MRLWETLELDIAPLMGKSARPPLNLGFGGSTLAACVHYFDRLPGRVIKEHGPLRSLVVYAGENDLGDGKSVADVVDSFFWLHAMVREWNSSALSQEMELLVFGHAGVRTLVFPRRSRSLHRETQHKLFTCRAWL